MSTFGPLARASVPDQVFARLCEMIISGHYAPGERLPTQRALAAEFGVNMASVREAVKRLEQISLIEVRHGDAMRVLDWRNSGLEVLPLLGTVDGTVVRPLFEARRMVLTEVARLAAQRRSEQQADQIQEAVRAIGLAADDEAAQLADWAFVSAVVEASGNLVFQLLGNSVRRLYLARAPQFLAIVTGRDELEPLYEAVSDAIRDSDPDRAAEAMSRLTAVHEGRMLESL
jgi:GntR family transcriptional repressor for pyruvate dehydrogenase complex